MNLKNIELIDALPQSFYDSFNEFIISSDLKIFGKLLARARLLEVVKDVPGDIVECGVFKGSGLFTFLKLKRYLCPNSCKRVIGFDFFNSEELLKTLYGVDKEAMSTLFDSRDFSHETSFKEHLEQRIISSGFEEHEFDLIAGDVNKTTYEYVLNNPGFKISLLYLDLDVKEPTYNTLCAFWDRVSTGGMVVFDEYAYQKWSESQGVDDFFRDKYIQVNSLNYLSPTAYVIK